MIRKNIFTRFFGDMRLIHFTLILVLFLVLMTTDHSIAKDKESVASRDQKIAELELAVQKITKQLAAMKAEKEIEENTRETEKTDTSLPVGSTRRRSWLNKLSLGGYGDIHANFTEGGGPSKFDLHRLVLNIGYEFTDWIKFNSEVEIEHAFVSDDSGGELAIEQSYLEFLVNKYANFRVGRVLTPLGIVNQRHLPPSFNGVERPSFDKYIIPTTWSSDGVGVFGYLLPSLKYEAYVVAGLDGSKFNAMDGIRKGRIKERPSLNAPSFTGRLDFFPFADRAANYGQMLRLGLSTYHGGLDNGNNGKESGIDGSIHIYSGDFEYSILDFDLRGAIAFEDISGAEQIGNGAASEIFGWYFEGAYHLFPNTWKRGLLLRSDAVVFMRYDYYNTQYQMPSGVAANPAGDRNEWTLGLTFYFTPNVVFKADYQIRNDASDQKPENLFNLGVGFQF